MNTHSMNTTTKLKIQVAILAIVSLALLPTIATAHGGEEHVTGTVTKISDTSVTVKTTAGKTVEVGLRREDDLRAREAAYSENRYQGRRSSRHPRHGDEREAGCPYAWRLGRRLRLSKQQSIRADHHDSDHVMH